MSKKAAKQPKNRRISGGKFKPGESGNPETKFKAGQSGNPSGRPPKTYSKMTEHAYKPSQINDTYLTLLGLPKSELKKIKLSTKETEYTALERWVASSVLKGIESGQIRDIETLLNRTFGFPKQQIRAEITEPLKPEGMTEEEIKTLRDGILTRLKQAEGE